MSQNEQTNETQYYDALKTEREISAKILIRAEIAEKAHKAAQTYAQSLEIKLAELQAKYDNFSDNIDILRAAVAAWKRFDASSGVTLPTSVQAVVNAAR